MSDEVNSQSGYDRPSGRSGAFCGKIAVFGALMTWLGILTGIDGFLLGSPIAVLAGVVGLIIDKRKAWALAALGIVVLAALHLWWFRLR